jgi:hypothetical protein
MREDFMTRVAIFIVQIVWMVVLGGLACAFFIDRTLIPLAAFLGSVPLGVIWFGALGAVLILSRESSNMLTTGINRLRYGTCRARSSARVWPSLLS